MSYNYGRRFKDTSLNFQSLKNASEHNSPRNHAGVFLNKVFYFESEQNVRPKQCEIVSRQLHDSNIRRNILLCRGRYLVKDAEKYSVLSVIL